MSTPSPQTITAQNQAALAGIHLPASAQHVLDSLESHLAAVLEHAKTASPGATRVIAGFADEVLDRLETWGVELRGTLESYRAKVQEVVGGNTGGETNTNTEASVGAAGTSASAAPAPKGATAGSGIGAGG